MKKLLTILLLASVATMYGGKYEEREERYKDLVKKQEKAIRAHREQLKERGTKYTELTQDDYGYDKMQRLEKTKKRYEAKAKYWEGRDELDEKDYDDVQEIIGELREMGAKREADRLHRKLPYEFKK